MWTTTLRAGEGAQIGQAEVRAFEVFTNGAMLTIKAPNLLLSSSRRQPLATHAGLSLVSIRARDRIKIGEEIELLVVGFKGTGVRLAVDCPKDLLIGVLTG